MKYLDPAEL